MSATAKSADNRLHGPALSDRAVAAIHVVVGVVLAAAVLFARGAEGDPLVFLRIADPIANGAVPYRDIAIEYPPLALFPIVIPRLLAGQNSPREYELYFSIISLALAVGVAGVLVWLARRGWSAYSESGTLFVFGGLSLAALPHVIWRFDILAALLTIVGVALVAAHRPLWAGFAMGLGGLTKLYPAFLMPVLIAYYVARRDWRQGVRPAAWLVVGAGVPVLAVLAEVVVFSGRGALNFLSYQEERGVEIESVLAGVVMLADVLGGPATRVYWGFGSFQVNSPLIEAFAIPRQIVEALLVFAFAAGGTITVRREIDSFGRVQPQTLIRYLLAIILLVMVTNKVLSPQYVAWLLPFGALLAAPYSLAVLAAVGLTSVVYPIDFHGLLELEPRSILLLNLRNLTLLGLFVYCVIPRRTASQSVATMVTPPTRPAPTPNTSSPAAR